LKSKIIYGRYEIFRCGKIISHARKNSKVLIGKIIRSGYREILLTINGKRRYFLLHRLVALAFIKNPNKYKTVNHIDCDKLNNHVNNLEWNSYSQNLIHARDNGLLKTKIDRDLAKKIKYSKGTYREIAKEFGISKTHVGCIKQGQRWSDV